MNLEDLNLGEFVEPELGLFIAMTVAMLGMARWYWGHLHARFFTVADGQVYRSGALRPGRLRRRVEKLGIRSVIDLRSARPEVDRERATLKALGVAHHHLPSKQVPSAETIDAVLSLLDQPENLPALLHCNHGVRRAAQFEAIYRMEYQRWGNQRALSKLRHRSAFMAFRSGSRSTRFLLNYVPRHARAIVIGS